MPFRAGNGTKELFMFQAYAKQREKKHHNKRRGNHKLVDVDSDSVPIWVPGFVLFPLPGQPWWMLDLDAAFWANMLFVAGSVIYVAQGLYFWHHVSHNGNPPMTTYDDYNANNPSNYLNLVGAAIFIANALASLVDWWLCAQQASVMNLSLEHVGDEQTEGKFLVQDMGARILNLYLWNNIFFMIAAVTWMIGGVWVYDRDTDTLGCLANTEVTKCYTFWLPFTATSAYLISSMCGLWEFYETAKFRKSQNLPPLPLFTTDFYKLDWFGWGDILYFLASALPFAQCFVSGYGNWPADDPEVLNGVVAPIYNTSNFLFLIDSLVYMIGYVLFIYDIIAVMKKRHDEEEAEKAKHGTVDHLHSSRESFSRSYGQDYENGGDDDGRADAATPATSHYVKNAINKMMLRRDSTLAQNSQARRGSGHGSTIMNLSQRSSFGNGGNGGGDASGYGQGIVLSPLSSPRGSFGSGSSPGSPPAVLQMQGGPRRSFGGGDAPMPPALGLGLGLGQGQGYPGGLRRSFGNVGDAPLPPALSAVPRAPSAAYR